MERASDSHESADNLSSDACLYFDWATGSGGREWFDEVSWRECGRAYWSSDLCTACPARVEQLLVAQ